MTPPHEPRTPGPPVGSLSPSGEGALAAAGRERRRVRPQPLPTRWRELVARAVARPFFALLALLARILPRSLLLGIADGGSGLVYRLFPATRRALLQNARGLLGPSAPSQRLEAHARAVLSSFSRFLVDLLSPRAKWPTQDLHQRTAGLEGFEAARAAGRGVIAATLHMGNYELASMELAALVPGVAIVYNRDPMGFVEALRTRRRREKGLEEIVIDDSPFFAINALERLRSGGVVLLSADQVAARDGELVPFLHGVAHFSLWPIRLSQASGAPILPAFNVLSRDGGYSLHLEEPIVPRDGEPPREMLLRLVAVLEERLRAWGDQWLMVRTFWVSRQAQGAQRDRKTSGASSDTMTPLNPERT